MKHTQYKFCIFVAFSLSLNAFAQTPPEVSFAQGILAYENQDFEEAALHFGRAVESEPENGRAAHYFGMCLIELERYEEAVEALETASDAFPDDVEIQIELGSAFLLWGNFAFASRILANAIRRSPDNARGHFLLGVALSRIGDCPGSSRHFERAREIDPDLTVQGRYIAGLCHAREDSYEVARQEFDPLVELPRENPISDIARRFVRMSLRAEGIETSVFSGRLTISSQYDRNPSIVPRSSPSHHSFGLVLQGDMTIRAFANEHHTLAGRVGIYRSFYFPDESVSDYNYTQASGSTFYQFRGEIGRLRHQLLVGYDYSLGLFDGDRPLTDGNHLYSELHGGRAVWSIRETDSLMTRISFISAYQKFAALRRNNIGFIIGLGQSFSAGDSGLNFYVEATMRIEQAHSEDYDVLAPGGLFSMSWAGPWELNFTGWVLYEHARHPRSSESRIDQQITTSLAVERRIIPHLGLTLSWLHSDNISTVERFDYGRDVVSLSLWGEI